MTARRLRAVPAAADQGAPDIRARLEGYVSDVLALPYAQQLTDLAIFEVAIEMGKHLRDAELGVAPRPRSPRPRRLHIATTGPESGVTR